MSAVALIAVLIPQERLDAPWAHRRLPTVPAAGLAKDVAKGEGFLLTPAARMSPGKRAYVIRINDVASLAGMIQPTSRVDIMSVDYDPDQGRRTARLFMSNMRVLAIGAVPDPAQSVRSMGVTVASIEVTPAEAEKLAIAAAQGPLQLVLRSDGEVENAPTPRRVRPPHRSSIVPSPARVDSLPPTVFRRRPR